MSAVIVSLNKGMSQSDMHSIIITKYSYGYSWTLVMNLDKLLQVVMGATVTNSPIV